MSSPGDTGLRIPPGPPGRLGPPPCRPWGALGSRRIGLPTSSSEDGGRPPGPPGPRRCCGAPLAGLPGVGGRQGESGRHCGADHCAGGGRQAAGWGAASAPVACLVAANWRRWFGGPWRRCRGLTHHHRWLGGGFGRRPAGGLLLRPVAGLGSQRLGWPRWAGAGGWRAWPQVWAGRGRVWRAGGFGRRFGNHLRLAAWRRAGAGLAGLAGLATISGLGWAEPKEGQRPICWACSAPSSTTD